MDRSLLIQTESSPGEILRQVYEYEKSINSIFSLQYICNHCQIPSKGHLSDVMKRRRKIKGEYIEKVFSFLGFSEKEIQVVVSLCELEKAKSVEQREIISREVILARKRLNIQTAKILGGSYNPFVFVKAFCSLGIENLTPTTKEISAIIEESEEDTQNALDGLLEQGWVSKKDEYYLYDKSICEIVFPQGDEYQFHLKHIELATQDGLCRLKKDFDDKKNTYFESTSLSVKQSEYQNFLKEFKNNINKKFSELESDKADSLVHFNFLIYAGQKVPF